MKPPSFRRLHLVQAAACVALIVGFCPVTKAAPKKRKEPAINETTPSASPSAAGGARLRLWKASDLPAGGTLRVRLLPGDGKSEAGAVSLSDNSNRYEIGDYRAVPAGHVSVEVTILPGGNRFLLPVYQASGNAGTVVVQVQGGEIRAEFVDDHPSTSGNARSFNVYNLLLGAKGDVQISAGNVVTAHLLSAGGSLRLGGLKPADYPLSAAGTDGDGKSFRWNGDTDLRKVRRATLLICPDVYGRMRPRLVEDDPIADPAAPSKNSLGTDG